VFIPELNKSIKIKLQVLADYFSKQSFWKILIFMNRNGGHLPIRMLKPVMGAIYPDNDKSDILQEF
jgi:hypothetical protein